MMDSAFLLSGCFWSPHSWWDLFSPNGHAHSYSAVVSSLLGYIQVSLLG